MKSSALAALGLLLVLVSAAPSEAGIVVKKNGDVFIGTLGHGAFKDARGENCAEKDYETLSLEWPQKFKGEDPLSRELTLKRSEIRWYDRDTDELTDEYMKLHADEKIDAKWSAAYVVPWKEAKKKKADDATAKACADCGAKAAADANFCARCGRGLGATKAQGDPFCANCGAKFSDDTKFCSKCSKARVGATPEKKDAAARPAEENFWKGVAIGTSVEYTLVTNFGTETKMTMKMILAKKDDQTYQLDSEFTGFKSEGTPIPWVSKPDPNAPASTLKTETLQDEDITVGGEKLRCQHTKTTDEANKMVTDAWICRGLLVKSVTKMDGAAKGSSDMTLEKIERK